MKIKQEVEDNEFPEWPPFPEHLILIWNGIREEMRMRLYWLIAMIPPIFPYILSDKEH